MHRHSDDLLNFTLSLHLSTKWRSRDKKKKDTIASYWGVLVLLLQCVLDYATFTLLLCHTVLHN